MPPTKIGYLIFATVLFATHVVFGVASEEGFSGSLVADALFRTLFGTALFVILTKIAAKRLRRG